MTGLTPYLIEKSNYFQSSLKKLIKTYKSQSQKLKFIQDISVCLEELIINPYPPKARKEPLPSNLKIPTEWVFYKLVIVIAKGASGQIRIMYLVNEQDRIIKPLWIYNHQQFAKRPSDKNIKEVITEAFE